MFDFDAGKLVVIGVVALVVIGPKELPRVLRQVGQTVAKLRRMATEFQSQFMDAMREAEMADVKEEMSKIAESAKIDVAFDPIRDIRNQIGGAIAGETHAHPPQPVVPALEATGNSVDLSALESTESPATGVLDESGLVGAGIAPAPEIEPPPSPSVGVGDDAAPAQHATLADVRQALDETLSARGTDSEIGQPGKPAAIKEHSVIKEHSA